MQNFFRQNRNILVVALSVFIVSMTALMLFLNTPGKDGTELKTDVLQSDSGGTATTEANYRNLFESGEDPFAVIKLDGHIIFTSGNFSATTGFSVDELRGKLIFSLIDGNDLTTFFSAFGKVIETGKPVMMIGPFGLVNRYGEYKTSMASIYPVMEEGRVSKIGIMIKDISEKLDSTVSSDSGDNADTVPGVVEAPAKPATIITRPTVTKKIQKKTETVETEPPVIELEKQEELKLTDPSWIVGRKLVMAGY